jgi:hypothetical protein
MPHKNPWFLITFEEISGIQNQLRDLRQVLPYQDQDRIDGVISVIKKVRDRRV